MEQDPKQNFSMKVTITQNSNHIFIANLNFF